MYRKFDLYLRRIVNKLYCRMPPKRVSTRMFPTEEKGNKIAILTDMHEQYATDLKRIAFLQNTARLTFTLCGTRDTCIRLR